MFMNNNTLSLSLNPQQSEAVTTIAGPLLVIAGAGSGKTRVITSRISYLLQQGVPAHAIVALTFTNKAAKEMKERVRNAIGSSSQLPFIGTFHAYCLQLLKHNPDLLPYPFFTILDDDDQHKILSTLIEQYNLKKQVTARQLQYHISSIKNRIKDPLINPGEDENPLIQKLFAAYEKEKQLSKAFDFDDLLIEIVRFFTKHPSFKQNHHETVRHLLIDEYQDTNIVQHELLKQMARNQKGELVIDSLCVVGDEDQSIYSWRGATIDNILNFSKDFPSTRTVKIEQNYRSTQEILTIANTIIQNNTQRSAKKLWSTKQGSHSIHLLSCLSEYQEGDAVTFYLQAQADSNELHTTAILYRAHYQSRAIEESLIRNAIPYKIIGGVRFYERKEIKDIISYARLIANPFDRAAFFRVLNAPTRSLGKKSEELFYQAWNNEPFLTFIDVAEKLIAQELFKGAKKEELLSFLQCFTGITHKDKPSTVLEHIITQSGYISYLKKSNDEQEVQSRLDNIKELMHAVQYMEANGTATLSDFLDEIALMQEKVSKDSEQTNAVLLMSLHAAKGLEFKTVIIIGLEEGILPSSRSLHNLDAIEEERRLFYVGITRARERLLLTYARYRYSYGQMNEQEQSRFVTEIPEELVPRYDVSYWKRSEFTRFFTSFEPSNTEDKVASFISQATNPMPVIQEKKQSLTAWKKNQPVHHKTFGIGTIQAIEQKNDNRLFITARFKSGIKKIDAQFLTTV